jgi:uncharacterized protein YaeQ
MHPSEVPPFLLTRVIAYALNTQDGLEFAPGGLSDPDEPCLRSKDLNGNLKLWIEVGNPSAKKLHKASKAAPQVKVYTYKDPLHLLREIAANQVHRADQIGIFSLESAFLDRLSLILEKDNRWGLMHNEGSLLVTSGSDTIEGELHRHQSESRSR